MLDIRGAVTALALGIAAMASYSVTGMDPKTARSAAAETMQAAFATVDIDQSGAVSLEEYLKLPGNTAIHRRNFGVFDFDHNGQLSRNEFDAIPGSVAPALRGAIDDPFDALLAGAIAAMDEANREWEKSPKMTLPANQFLVEYTRSLSPSGGAVRMHPNMRSQVDPNGNGEVTRDEVREFVKIELGIKRHNGTRLREATGRVVNLEFFLRLDTDLNAKLSQAEFEAGWPDQQQAAELFVRHDTNKDRAISLGEYASQEGLGWIDPVVDFLTMDRNLNGLMEESELTDGLTPERKPLAKWIFPNFDLNQDGSLDLKEYRESPVANPIVAWQRPLVDSDGDGQISFNEFQFGNLEYSLLRRLYFQRLDRDENGMLSANEVGLEQFPGEKPATAIPATD